MPDEANQCNEPDTTPLAFATLDQLYDELRRRADAVVVSLTLPSPDGRGSVRTRLSGPPVVTLGLARVVAMESRKRWDATPDCEVDEDGNVIDLDTDN